MILKAMLALRIIKRARRLCWRLFGSYRCDECGRKTRRWSGKADVSVEAREVPVDLAGERTMPARFVVLRCPQCAAKRREEQADAASKLAE